MTTAKDPDVTVEYVLQFVSYDPATGHFHRVRRTAQRHRVGDRADTKRKGEGSYATVCFPGYIVRAHRLAWFLSYGRWPNAQIDHKDGNRSNNSLSNLREATSTENRRNGARQPRKYPRGVGYDSSRHKWVAKVKHQRKTYNLGRYSTMEEAAAVAEKFREEHHGVFARHD